MKFVVTVGLSEDYKQVVQFICKGVINKTQDIVFEGNRMDVNGILSVSNNMLIYIPRDNDRYFEPHIERKLRGLLEGYGKRELILKEEIMNLRKQLGIPLDDIATL